jgi:hypothetical protein
MRSLPVYVWCELQLAMTLLDENSSLREVFVVVLSWIRGNYKCFPVEPFRPIGLMNFRTLMRILSRLNFHHFYLAI